MTPRVALAAVLAAVLGAGCGRVDPVAGPDLRVEVRAPAEPVAPGAAFPVTVVRAWRTGETPSAASDRDLAPLAARLLASSRRDDGTRVEERLDYAAHAFSLTDVVLRPVPLAVRAADGTERRAASAPARVAVRPTLPPDAPGVPEFPEPAPREPWPWAWTAALGLAAAGAALLVRRRRRARAAPPSSDAVPAAPDADARLRATTASLAAAEPAVAVPAAADALRAWLRERHGVPASERTTEETLALAAALPSRAREAATRVLRAADAVKFAQGAPGAADRDEVLARAAEVAPAAGGDAP